MVRGHRRYPSVPLPRIALHPTLSALLVCCAAASAQPQPEPHAVADPLGSAVLVEVNRYRSSQGLHPLQQDHLLLAIAAEHSQTLAREGRLSHSGFAQRFQRSGAALCVENLAAGLSRAELVVAAWRQSPAHHLNLLDARVQQVGLASTRGVVAMLACRTDPP